MPWRENHYTAITLVNQILTFSRKSILWKFQYKKHELAIGEN